MPQSFNPLLVPIGQLQEQIEAGTRKAMRNPAVKSLSDAHQKEGLPGAFRHLNAHHGDPLSDGAVSMETLQQLADHLECLQ